jgi:hypothetical protein
VFAVAHLIVIGIWAAAKHNACDWAMSNMQFSCFMLPQSPAHAKIAAPLAFAHANLRKPVSLASPTGHSQKDRKRKSEIVRRSILE